MESTAYVDQPPQTTPDALNCVFYDISETRARGSRRPGFTQFINAAVSSGNRIQVLDEFTRVLPSQAVLPGDVLFEIPGDIAFPDGTQAHGTLGLAEDLGVGASSSGTFPPLYGDDEPSGTQAFRWVWVSNELVCDWEGVEAVPDIDAANTSENQARTLTRPIKSLEFDDTEAFVIRMGIKTFADNGNNTNSRELIGAVIRGNRPDDEGIICAWQRDSGDPNGVNQSLVVESEAESPTIVASVGLSEASDTNEHILEVRVNKHYIELWWDNSRELIADVSGLSSNDDADDVSVSLLQLRERSTGTWTNQNQGSITFFEIREARQPGSLRETKLVGSSGGDIFVREPGGDTITPVGGSGALSADQNIVETVSAFQRVFFLDSDQYKVLDLSNGEVSAWTTTTGGDPDPLGNLPNDDDNDGTADTAGAGARFGALWGGRIVLSGVEDDAAEVFLSRIGDPFDFDFTATGDVSAATLLSGTDFGVVGDPVTALMPHRDKRLVLGTFTSIWAVNGNPLSANGEIINLSKDVGVAGHRAWTHGPNRSIFFLGTDGGLYELKPNQFAIDETNKVSEDHLDNTLDGIDLSNNLIQLEWSPRLRGLIIWVSPTQSQGSTTHYFWSRRTRGFIPWSLPDVMGPTATHYFQVDDPDERGLLIGSFDSLVHRMDFDGNNDDGTTISSHVLLGPIQSPWPGSEFIIERSDFVLGEGSADLQYDIRAGDTPQSAVTAAASASGSLSAGRNDAVRDRVRGSAAFYRLSDATDGPPWIFEQLEVDLVRTGRQRKR